MKLRLQADAEAELDDAIGYYEGQQTGLGLRFLETVESKLAQIAAQPEACPKLFGEWRVAFPRGFPYSIVYRLEPETIRVLAIFHQSRDPRRIRQRIRATPSD